MNHPDRVLGDRVTITRGPDGKPLAPISRYISVDGRGRRLEGYTRRDLLVHFSTIIGSALFLVLGAGYLGTRIHTYLSKRGAMIDHQSIPGSSDQSLNVDPTISAEMRETDLLNQHIKEILKRRGDAAKAAGRFWQVIRTPQPLDLSMAAPKGLHVRGIPSRLGWFVRNTHDGRQDPTDPYNTLKYEGGQYLGTYGTFINERDQHGKVLGVWTAWFTDRPLTDEGQEFFAVYDPQDPQQLVRFRARLNGESGEVQEVPLEYFLKQVGIPPFLANRQPVTK